MLQTLAQKASSLRTRTLAERHRTAMTLEKAMVQAWVKPTAPIRQLAREIRLELRLRRLDLTASLLRRLERRLMEAHRRSIRSTRR